MLANPRKDHSIPLFFGNQATAELNEIVNEQLHEMFLILRKRYFYFSYLDEKYEQSKFPTKKSYCFKFLFTNLTGNKVIYKDGKSSQTAQNYWLFKSVISLIFNKRHTGKAEYVEYMVTCSCTKAIHVNLC